MRDCLWPWLEVNYLRHPRRPRIHAAHDSEPRVGAMPEVGINCVPGRGKQRWIAQESMQRVVLRALQGLAHLTQGSFRPVCLEQVGW